MLALTPHDLGGAFFDHEELVGEGSLDGETLSLENLDFVGQAAEMRELSPRKGREQRDRFQPSRVHGSSFPGRMRDMLAQGKQIREDGLVAPASGEERERSLKEAR